MSLTPKQRRLKAEIEELSAFVQMDHWNIAQYSKERRTTVLELIKRQLIVGDVVTKYTVIDELLSVIICHYYFGEPSKGRSFRQHWKSQKFQIFIHYIMDDTYLLNKLKLARAISEIPPKIRDAVERINAVRNALAHSFYPENRRQYVPRKKVIYQGADVYTQQGIEKFAEDFEAVKGYLWQRAGWE
jgi:hypothetical protein